MTLSLAWVRSAGKTKDLVMATDSRMRAGRAWDVGPKILTLARTDCAICFAGAARRDRPAPFARLVAGLLTCGGYKITPLRSRDC